MVNRTLLLPLLLSLTTVAACATKAPTLQRFPPAEDLQPPAKPSISIDTLTSARASEQHNADIEAWGDGLYRQVLRLCRWSKTMGAPVACPAP